MVQAREYVTQAINRKSYAVEKFRKRSCAHEMSLLMDINVLQEHYDSIRKRQREQHCITFRSVKSKPASGAFLDLQIKTVTVNCTVRKQKAFVEQLPVKRVTLELPKKDYMQDNYTPWRTHLDLHRVVQAQDCKCHKFQSNGKVKEAKENNVNSKIGLTGGNFPPDQKVFPGSLDHTIPNGEATAYMTFRPDELEKSNHSFNKHNHCVPKINKRYSLPSERSHILASKDGLVTRAPSSLRLDYYPFPQLKPPRKSDAAKSLGLYAQH
ncbi:uncharacterized protein LOC103190767 isoform X2 [Callorhinchus milii]|nr:uncharacterized protein LOC103190767 isoform X2 [Callorhinchus milii]|eukprot:gi/632985725/ref/XP_007909845.1/ PREDICTED: uncharacterized protein LOC103190767 [Callorhinchus milii]